METFHPNLNDYPAFVRERFKTLATNTATILHAAVGISGEAGELLDCVKKTWIYNKSLDCENLIEELGDLEFYMEAMRVALGVTRFAVLRQNMAKLAKRYPAGYTDAAAQARMDKSPTAPTTSPFRFILVTELGRFYGTDDKDVVEHFMADGCISLDLWASKPPEAIPPRSLEPLVEDEAENDEESDA